jgi:hypothetical protein
MDGQRTTTDVLKGGKDQSMVLVSCAIILPAAFLFSSVAALPHVFLFVLFGLLLSLLVKKTLKYSDRSLIYSFVTALVLAVLFDMVFPMKQDRFFVMAKLFMANITVPVILYLAVFATFYQSNPYTLGFSASLSLIALMLCANYQLSGSNEADLPLISTLLDHFTVFYISVVSFDTVMILLGLNLARKSPQHTFARGFDWRKHLVYASALLIAAASALIFFSLSRIYREEILKAEAYFRRLRLRDFSPKTPSGAFFGSEVDLRASMRADRSVNKDLVMLRVSGDNPPGYLRGQVYQYYQSARWSKATDPQRQMNYRLNVEGLAVNAFFKDDFPGETRFYFEIYPTSACVADFMFLPGNTLRIDTVADRVGFTRNGFFKPKTWESDGGYTVGVDRLEPMAAYQHPDLDQPRERKKYLQTPSALNKTLDAVLADIFSNVKSETRHTRRTLSKKRFSDQKDAVSINRGKRVFSTRTGGDEATIEKVRSYFSKNFEYTLSPKGPEDDTDPVEYFLTTTKRGHCELFATATVLLLRRAGIPARYVTGLLCFERHPTGGYFVSRLGNAHAWVEAYSRDKGKWLLVESTPPSASEFHTSFGVFDAWGDRIKQLWRETFAGIRRGYVARSILFLLASLFGFLFDLLWHPIRGAVVLVCATFLWWAWSRSGTRKKRRVELAPEITALSLGFTKNLRTIQKKLNESKLKHESWDEWAARIADRLPPEMSVVLLDLVRRYNALRFSGEMPSKAEIGELMDSVTIFKKELLKFSFEPEPRKNKWRIHSGNQAG